MLMFVIRVILKNIRCHIKKSFLAILISTLIVSFLLLFIQNIKENESQLSRLNDTMKVRAIICNIDGSQEVGLQIDYEKLQKIPEGGLVKDEVITIQAYADLEGIKDDMSHRPALSFIGSNSLSPFSAFTPQDISYIDNYSESFLKSDEAVCVVRDKFLKEQNLNLGDELEIEIYTPEYDTSGWQTFTYQKIDNAKLKLIGSYHTKEKALEELPDIISSTDFLISIYNKNNEQCYASSGSFTLTDNLKLNEFKYNMKEIGFLSVDIQAGFSRIGEALTMNDETFILSATQLTDSIILLKGLAPLIFIVVAMIGFIASYLLMQSRQNEFAIMRSLGTSKKRCFNIIFIESMILVLLGSLLGAVLSSAIVDINSRNVGLILGLFVFFYMLGTTIALLLLNRFSVMAILSKTD